MGTKIVKIVMENIEVIFFPGYQRAIIMVV